MPVQPVNICPAAGAAVRQTFDPPAYRFPANAGLSVMEPELAGKTEVVNW